jgi:hypothetical protein
MGYCAPTPARSPGPCYMQGPEKNFKKNITFFFQKMVKKKSRARNFHSRSLSVQTGCDPRLAADRRSLPAEGSGRRPGDRWSAADQGHLPGDRFPTGGRPSLATRDCRPLVGRPDQQSATAPARVPHYVHPVPPLPNLLAHRILHMRSTLPHWLQHMPALPRLLLETSNIHNF